MMVVPLEGWRDPPCLGRRILDKDSLIGEIAAWQNADNALQAKPHVPTADARVTLERLAPAS